MLLTLVSPLFGTFNLSLLVQPALNQLFAFVLANLQTPTQRRFFHVRLLDCPRNMNSDSTALYL